MLWLAILTAAGAAMRLFDLSGQSLWMDEVASINNMRQFAQGGFEALAKIDRIAPLHSVLLYITHELIGGSAFAMRLPSALAGALTVPFMYLIAVRLFGSRQAALIAAAIVAFSPYAIFYAQEARMYSILLLSACAYVALVWPVVDRNLRSAELLAVFGVTTIGLYAHHYMIFVPAAFGAFLLLHGGMRQSRFWLWSATQVAALACFMPWIIISSEQLAYQTALPKPNFPLWIPYTLYTYVAGLSLGPSVRELQSNSAIALSQNWTTIAAVATASTILCILGLARSLATETRKAGIWTISWLVAPLALAILATFLTKVQYNVRYAVVSYPPIALWLSLALKDGLELRSKDTLTPRVRWVVVFPAAALLVATFMSIHNLYFNDEYAKEDVRPLASLLAADHSKKIIVTDNSRVEFLLAHYGARLPADAIQVDNLLWARTPKVAETSIDALDRSASREIWLIEYRSTTTDPEMLVRKKIESLAELIDRQEWPGVSLRRYRFRHAG